MLCCAILGLNEPQEGTISLFPRSKSKVEIPGSDCGMILECVKEAINESTPVSYWPQLYKFDKLSVTNRLY
jgi:hypothetical protein